MSANGGQEEPSMSTLFLNSVTSTTTEDDKWEAVRRRGRNNSIRPSVGLRPTVTTPTTHKVTPNSNRFTLLDYFTEDQVGQLEGDHKDNHLCAFGYIEKCQEEQDILQEILAVQQKAGSKGSTGKRVLTKVRAMADSGACQSACPPAFARTTCPINSVAPTEKYRAANGTRILHYGDKKVAWRTQRGQGLGLMFQVADVSRPLVSIPEITQAGHDVVLSKAGGEIRHSSGEIIPLERVGNAYYLDMVMELEQADADEMMAAGFARPV